MFLEHCFRRVITEGVLVFVIPVTALGACARLLASQFERICMLRLERPECARFEQIVAFGERKKSHARGDVNGADALVRASFHLNLIPAVRRGSGAGRTECGP